MSAGAPVIALSAGALDEVVEEGRSGWLLPEDGFVEGAARILRRLAADRPSVARLSHSAYAAFHESFSTQAMARGILDYYRAAVAASREQA